MPMSNNNIKEAGKAAALAPAKNDGAPADESSDATMRKISLAAASVGIFYSDRRLKHNIKMVGTSPSGIPVYTFQYNSDVQGMDSQCSYSGVMAQDLLLADDHADAVVVAEDGFYMVDYSKIDVDMHKLD